MIRFRSKQISERITRIYAPGGEQMYLITGTGKAVLVDTGAGVGDLKAYVQSLTKLPITVLLTHNHIDHAMGTRQFDTVYLSAIDKMTFDSDKADVGRRGYLSMSPCFSEIEESDYIPIDDPRRFRILNDGDVFELGDCTVEAIAYGGHTGGSMTFLVVEESTLLMGDAAGNFTMMQGPMALPISVYQKSTQRMIQRMQGRVERILLSHEDVIPPLNMLDEILEVCDEILRSTDDRIPFSFMGEDSYIAKQCGYSHNEQYGISEHLRLDGGFSNIIYNPKQL